MACITRLRKKAQISQLQLNDQGLLHRQGWRKMLTQSIGIRNRRKYTAHSGEKKNDG